ncbi:hypothetical protein AN958_08887 [Leucoagaricus sp. SymC.cos]|nr:hypothetical protein AN958_08887 [Leucoagaricus sp. SymC.cos]
MAKRQLIPAALREEFTEYSSLLRALRTSQTLDVTAHLTQPYANDHDVAEPGPSGSAPPASTSTKTATESGPSGKRKRSKSEPDVPHWRNRDQWTRWPIPAKDVPPPEWCLQDEIGTIVKQVLASKESDSDAETDDMEADPPLGVKQEQDSEVGLGDIEDEDAYVQRIAEFVTPVVQNQLESLFALISAHTIARSDSMQTRIEPFDWRDLMNILGSPGATHLVDETYIFLGTLCDHTKFNRAYRILKNVAERMEDLFETTPASSSNSVPSPSPATAIHRHSIVQSSRSRLNDLLSKHTASLFEQSLPPPDHKYITLYQISLRKKKAEKRRRRRPIDDENNEDDESENKKGKGRAPQSETSEATDEESGWESSEDGTS